MLDHSIDILTVSMLILSAMFGTHMCAQVHARSIPPAEEWFTCSMLSFYDINCSSACFIIDCLHAFFGKRTSIFNRLFANLSKAWVNGWIIHGTCFTSQYTTRTPLCFERWVFWI